jgi:hypothetical protein
MSENFVTWYQLIMYNAIRSVDGGDAHGNKYSFSSIAAYVRLENIGKWYAAIHARLRAIEAVWGTSIISVDISAEITEAKLHHGKVLPSIQVADQSDILLSRIFRWQPGNTIRLCDRCP